MSGLVMLLPHGLDGGGPDHATAHPERLLAACADGNMQVANPSTPANYFHLLRRQQVLPFRKPLAVLAPKMLLRHRACVSDLAELDAGTGFRPLIADGPAAGAQRLVFCSGKVAYELAEARAHEGLDTTVTLVRLERLYPFPERAAADLLARHPNAEVVFCQEEPANMGPYAFVQPRLARLTDRRVGYAGRRARPAPAVSRSGVHAEERAALLTAALSGRTAAPE
jgi:2-oxoglutarate dehydrogenase E1 component